MSTSIIQFRIDDELKAEATALYEKLGIDLSTAMRMFLKRSVSVNGIPFSMILPPEGTPSYGAYKLIKELNTSAVNNGVSEMSLDEINEEISLYRNERKRGVIGK
ncbi:MAG: type II toxin-antitoxin system RelB/DinJ family antitoxin [Clostridia bacterium]|nr:type II toxin-antitoxin system RelB/DinJ family antitoxin [Clostridia bacterium]